MKSEFERTLSSLFSKRVDLRNFLTETIACILHTREGCKRHFWKILYHDELVGVINVTASVQGHLQNEQALGLNFFSIFTFKGSVDCAQTCASFSTLKSQTNV